MHCPYLTPNKLACSAPTWNALRRSSSAPASHFTGTCPGLLSTRPSAIWCYSQTPADNESLRGLVWLLAFVTESDTTSLEARLFDAPHFTHTRTEAQEG